MAVGGHMPIEIKVPHDELVVRHQVIDDPNSFAVHRPPAYLLTLSEPDGREVGRIVFQKGIPREGWKGWTTAKVIEGLIEHMEYHQSTKLECEENGEILFHLRAALDATKHRATDRKNRGVLYDPEKP